MKTSNIVGLTIGILTIISIVGGAFLTYANSTKDIIINEKDIVANKAEVEKLEVSIDRQEERVDDLEKYDIRQSGLMREQTILIENAQNTQRRIVEALDRLERPARQPSNYLPGI